MQGPLRRRIVLHYVGLWWLRLGRPRVFSDCANCDWRRVLKLALVLQVSGNPLNERNKANEIKK
jgi:hypothetical protein